MPGLVPGIHGLQHGGMHGGWVYVMTNRPNGTLCLGATRNARHIAPTGARCLDPFG